MYGIDFQDGFIQLGFIMNFWVEGWGLDRVVYDFVV